MIFYWIMIACLASCMYIFFKFLIIVGFGKEQLVKEIEGDEYFYKLLKIPEKGSDRIRYYIENNGTIEFAILKTDSTLEVIEVGAEDIEIIDTQDSPYVSIRLVERICIEKWAFLKTPKYSTVCQHCKLYIPNNATTAEP